VLRRFTVLAVVVLAGVLPLAWAGSASPRTGSAPESAGSSAATALDLFGKTVNPFEMSGGKPLVLIFVRTDCPVSNRYAPTIKALNQKYAGPAVLMLVYPDKSETPQNIGKHLHDYGYKMAALRDTQHDLVKVSKVEITPEAAVFDGRGELIYHGRIDNWYVDFGHARSAPTTHELDEAIQAALNSAHPAPTSVSGIGCYISDLQ
jgi:thiol-disulfide isomerase/thioredoxin